MKAKRKIEPWAIGVPAFLTLFAACMISFAVWTIGRNDALVNDDYYALDVTYQERLEATERAIDQEALKIESHGKTLVLTFKTEPSAGTVRLYRPSDAKLDEKFALEAEHIRMLDTSALATGLWIVQAEWKAAGERYYMQEDLILE